MIRLFLWRLSTRCHLSNNARWVRLPRPSTRRSSSTIFGTSNAFTVSPATRLITRAPSAAGARNFSRSASPRVHRCANCSTLLQWVDIEPLGRCRSPSVCLWTGGHLNGDHGEVESGWRQRPLLSKVSQAPPRAAQSVNTYASPFGGDQAARGGATRFSSPSTTD